MANPENLREQTEKMKNGLAAEIGAKGGANKKGSRHLTTLIREIGYNFDWSKTTLKNKDELKKQYGKNFWEALVYVQATKAIAGDSQAAKWLAENGYGKQVNMDLTGESIVADILKASGLIEGVDNDGKDGGSDDGSSENKT